MKLTHYTKLISALPVTDRAVKICREDWRGVELELDSIYEFNHRLFNGDSSCLIDVDMLREVFREDKYSFLILVHYWRFPKCMVGLEFQKRLYSMPIYEAEIEYWVQQKMTIDEVLSSDFKAEKLGLDILSLIFYFGDFKTSLGVNALIWEEEVVLDEFRLEGDIKNSYLQFVSQMQQLATKIDVSAENLQYFLSMFSGNLKTSEKTIPSPNTYG